MAARHHHNMVTSPRKKKSKRRVDGDEGAVVSVHKRRRHAPEFEDPVSQVMEDDPSGCRRSGRSGAGSGGRAVQLEKIGSALQAPVNKPRKATDLPEDVLDNPLAPEKHQKGGRRKNVSSLISH